MRGMRNERTMRWRCHHLRTMNSPSATASSNRPHWPSAVSTPSRSSTVELNSEPRYTADPTQISAPSPSYSTKLRSGVPITPASALAMEAKPGTNLATSSDLAPQRP
ncbi:MAG: hypothetical protein GAK34_03822 [Delftia tsuruhatensis]|nr:MAG: hypothetical protein GAK34_03822 [Delftia tsuruhatensis]